MVYMSYFQHPGYETMVQVKTEGNPVDLEPMVENAIHEIDTQLPVFDVRSMRESTQMASTFAVIESTLAGMFALIGLLLAITGIYGVVAYRTQLRTHEIGIRMALGASRVNVLRLVLMQGLWLTGLGLALGLAFALGLTRMYRPAVVRHRRQRSHHRRFRRHAPGSNVFSSMLPSGASSDAPKSCDCDSRTVNRRSGLDAYWTDSGVGVTIHLAGKISKVDLRCLLA